MKISKASWMILAAGVFIIILAGLGLARSGQLKDQSAINEELLVVQTRLDKVLPNQFQTQIAELEEQMKDASGRAEEARERLDQTVISVDVADKFYEIADFYEVTVRNISTSSISEQPYESIDCETISVSAMVSGGLPDIIDFIIGLNNNYVTGFVRNAQLSVSGAEGEETAIANVQMTVYSRKETDNGK